MALYEYSTELQSNLNWGESFRMAVKAPAIADRIFETWDNANEYIHDRFNSAIAGLNLTVIGDGDKNGTYFIDSIARTEGYVDDYGNVYTAGEKELVMVRLTSLGGDRHINWTEQDPTSDTYVKNKPYYTDNTQNRISIVRRADMIDGQLYTDRTELVSDDDIVYFLRDGAEYTLYGVGNKTPRVLITWTDNINQFPSIEDANTKYREVDISQWPELIRIGTPSTYVYYKLTYQNYKIGIHTDGETIVKTGGFISVNSPKVKIREYSTLEDYSRIIYCKLKTDCVYEYGYVEVNKSDYEYIDIDGQQHDKVLFKDLEQLDSVVTDKSYLFVHTTLDDKYYRRYDIAFSSIKNGETGTEIVYTQDLDDKLFFVDGRIYQIIKNRYDDKFLALKTIFNDDSIINSLEMLEKKIYLNDNGTDTKNTAGSMNTNDKIYIVGSKTKATTADNDNKQTYTNGNNYVGSDGWLYTGNNEKVLVDANLNFIRDALASMEEWPTVSTETTVSPQPTCYLTTNPVPNTIENYYRVTYGSTNVDVLNGGVYRAGSSLTTRNNISVNTTTTFHPSIDATYIAKNRIYGMDYGYKNNLSDATKYTEHEKTSTTEIATTCDRTDVSKTQNTKIELFKKVNSGDYSLAASASNSWATTSISISSGTNLGTLEEGTTKLLIKYTNTSTIARTEASGNVDGISAYYSSNINNFDSSHKKTITTQTVTIGEVDKKYANGSTDGVKTGTEVTIYGVYPLYTNGSQNKSSAITGDNRTNGTTGSASTYREFESLINYAANGTSTWYVSFGEIDTNNTNVNKAYIFTPNVTGGRTVTITDVQGANSSTESYDSGTVNMTVVNDATVNITVDGVSRSYKRWWIKNPGGSEGANSYKVTITAANE